MKVTILTAALLLSACASHNGNYAMNSVASSDPMKGM